ncbi:hypothetical protein SAY86_000648 [Trapa natans]|uniref:Protein kinase domain-containing protein n=1 Tax=Trapa natans TaxID=22666 RepID=A0AAN7RGU5_TRANT|nr:hypothetical protein SAY86_000648 [Trapa natans]
MRRYFSCNGESAVSTCDLYNWDCTRVAADAPNRGRPEPGAAACNNGYTYGGKTVRIRRFRHSELAAATGDFSAHRFLGKGSHGSVYRASLDGGRLIAAVKRAKHPASISFYDNEIEILSRVRGPRFVNLIGVCNDNGGGDDKSFEGRSIVVEYMPNGCLYDLLHRSPRPIGWSDRVRLALQVAKSVRCLHGLEPPVMHRDIKSTNVLIDGKWNARLGDFGLALRGRVEDIRARSTPPAGTLGYLDPAYTAPGDLSEKSDVFSFGILLLEMISGRNAIDVSYSPPSVVDWAVPLIKSRRFASICDPRIGLPVDPAIVHVMAAVAERCVRAEARRRPSMAEVAERLEIAREKVRAVGLWGNLRRRISCTDHTCYAESYPNEADGEVDVVGYVRRSSSGSRTRKVSSVSTAAMVSDGLGSRITAASGMISCHVVRSRSVGPGRIWRHGSSASGKEWAAARLNRSWSVGGHSAPKSKRGIRIDMENEEEEEESDNKLLEKPLVATVN